VSRETVVLPDRRTPKKTPRKQAFSRKKAETRVQPAGTLRCGGTTQRPGPTTYTF